VSSGQSAQSAREDGLRAGDVQERLAYLHAATVRIGIGLDIEQSVRALCETAVPLLADLAVAYLLDIALVEGEPPEAERITDAPVRRMAVAQDGLRGEWKRFAATERQTLVPGSLFAETMTTGQPVLHPSIHGLNGNLGDILPSGGGGSLLVVPLRVDARVLGFAAFLRTPDRRSFDDTDLLTACLMADQAALSVRKAQLYQREARMADALQRSMLPTRPPTLPGVEIAYRYLPANPAAQVGGDWFEAIPLPGSRVAFVVGDVMGHGIRSAAAMGQLRTAVRTLAALDPPPDQVLRHLDDLAQQLGEHQLATCIYCIYDPVTRRCTIANAGHIPPVLVHPGGEVELLRVPTGAPVGLGGVAFEPVEVGAPDGGLLVLCTDGLVESRNEDISDGLARLCRGLRRPVDSLDDLCERLTRAQNVEDREDDVALLVARFHGIPSHNVAQWILRPHPQTPARVRRLVRSTLTGWRLEEHARVTELLATELVTNAIRYASRPIGLRLMRTDVLLCEVTDDDHHLPVLRQPTDTDESGRGLHLVSRLSRRWGSSRTTTGKAVWFEQSI
jgi:hypothetical protein